MGGDGHPGLLLGARARPQDVLDDRGDALGVGGALDDRRLDSARPDAPGDVAHEEIRHLVDAVAEEVSLRHPPHAGGHDHLHPRAPGHVHDQVDVPSEIHGGEVDDGADAAGVEVGHLPFRSGEDGRPVEEMRPVLVHAGGARDDVLVHQGGPEAGGGNGAEGGGYG